MKSLCFIILIIGLLGCQNNSMGSSHAIPLTDPLAKEAMIVTNRQFSVEISKSAKDGWKYADYVSNIENYNVTVSSIGQDRLLVKYLIKQPTDGDVIKGSGGEYEVDRKTHNVINFKAYE